VNSDINGYFISDTTRFFNDYGYAGRLITMENNDTTFG
jgi:hypothetical protein